MAVVGGKHSPERLILQKTPHVLWWFSQERSVDLSWDRCTPFRGKYGQIHRRIRKQKEDKSYGRQLLVSRDRGTWTTQHATNCNHKLCHVCHPICPTPKHTAQNRLHGQERNASVCACGCVRRHNPHQSLSPPQRKVRRKWKIMTARAIVTTREKKRYRQVGDNGDNGTTRGPFVSRV